MDDGKAKKMDGKDSKVTEKNKYQKAMEVHDLP